MPVSKPRKNTPHPVDVYVGGRIRLRRIRAGISQEKLGMGLGISFQQVQKYEKGSNRVSASSLYRISTILHANPGWFFEGYKNGHAPVHQEMSFLSETETLRTLRAFGKVDSKIVRDRLVDVAIAVGKYA